MTDEKVDRESASVIVADAMKVRDGLTTLHDELQQEFDDIALAAARANRPMTDGEKDRRRKLRSDQANVRDAFEMLAFATLEQLDNSADVAELKDRLDGINANLAGDLARLKKIRRYAEIAAQVADGLAQLAIKAAGALA
jgi:hypothetical protein